jgi:tetratricopeptide (TPR) repeat protein
LKWFLVCRLVNYAIRVENSNVCIGSHANPSFVLERGRTLLQHLRRHKSHFSQSRHQIQGLFFPHDAAMTEAIGLDADYGDAYFYRGMAYYGLGDYERARSSCEAKRSSDSAWCLAMVFEKLRRHSDAQAQLARLHASLGNAAAYQYADTYAQWGDRVRALDWLETAMRLRDPGVANVKTDPLMDPLRNEPRFQAVERALNFPD